ncbi:MAG: PPC domain-containing DNA-binding protein [bacterium]|nr:PPC domain-containing DNA-binding protein [bacterium]
MKTLWRAGAIAWSLVLASGGPMLAAPAIEAHAFRLRPGQDLLEGLLTEARSRVMRAGCVLSAVGSLRHVRVRFADRPEPTDLEGPFEIVSCSGTVTREGAHVHLAVVDGEGRTFGGHLVPGNPVFTTAEIVLGELPGVVFTRESDVVTGYRELVVSPRSPSGASASPPPRGTVP